MIFLSSKYKNIIILICLCVASMILSWLNSFNFEGDQYTSTDLHTNPIKKSLSFLLIPNQLFERIVSTITSKLSDSVYFITYTLKKPVMMEELESLQNTVDILSRQLDEERGKNKRLEELWKLSKGLVEVNPSFSLIPASVISVEPTDWFRYITINKGRKHGITVDMPVITQTMYPSPKSTTTTKLITGSVIGRIKSVDYSSAKVQLITDRESAVAVTIGPLRDLAILRGQPEKDNCSIDEIPSTTHDMLYVGDAVIVDERSSIFPPGMLVGWISSINRQANFCHIEVQPAYRFNRLKEVIVILDARY